MGLKNFGPSVNYLSVEQLKHSFVALLSLNRTTPILNPPRIRRQTQRWPASWAEDLPHSAIYNHILPNHGVNTNYQVIPVINDMGIGGSIHCLYYCFMVD